MTNSAIVDFLMLCDLPVRDGPVIDKITAELLSKGYSVDVRSLRDEVDASRSKRYRVIVINKPHFHVARRLWNKLLGVKYAVLDTEGLLPMGGAQVALMEPDGYFFWTSLQAKNYNFSKTHQVLIGYPRSSEKVKFVPSPGKITIASNLAAFGYTDLDLRKRKFQRKLKLKNDFCLLEYAEFQAECAQILKSVVQNNPEKEFYIKPHPNDPVSFWEESWVKNATNLTLVDSALTIFEFFGSVKPELHVCFDACTTVLDAHLCDIPVAVLGRNQAAASADSILEGLAVKRIESQALAAELTGGKQQDGSDGPTGDLLSFINEVEIDTVSKVAEALEVIYLKRPVYRIYDMPTMSHFIFIIKMIGRWFAPWRSKASDRKKVVSSNLGSINDA